MLRWRCWSWTWCIVFSSAHLDVRCLSFGCLEVTGRKFAKFDQFSAQMIRQFAQGFQRLWRSAEPESPPEAHHAVTLRFHIQSRYSSSRKGSWFQISPDRSLLSMRRRSMSAQKSFPSSLSIARAAGLLRPLKNSTSLSVPSRAARSILGERSCMLVKYMYLYRTEQEVSASVTSNGPVQFANISFHAVCVCVLPKQLKL